MRGRGERMRKKAERRWTVMVVPHGSGSSRAVEVSQTFVKALVGIGSVVALTFLVLGVAAISRGVNITHSRALENENRLLADEIQRMRERMTVVRDSLKALGPGGQQALAARLDVDALARRANILVRSLNEAYDSLSKNRALMAATPSIMPTKGWLTSAFMRERIHPILHLARPHEGIDVTAPMGAEIEAPAAGIVTEVRWEEGYGNIVTMDHGFGLVTRFAHCSKILVVRGQRVKRGQVIAKVGSTGLSTGPHLHYEVWVNHKPVDPMKYVMPDAIVD